MKKPFLIYLLLVLLLFGACTKEGIVQTAGNKKIAEIQNGSKETIGVFTYSDKGLTESSWYIEEFYQKGEKRHYTYSYSSDGVLTGKKGYEPGNMLMSSWIGGMGKNVEYQYSYDSKGRIAKIVTDYKYPGNGNYDYSTQQVFEYPDDLRVVVTTNNINPLANSIAQYMEYVYNKSGNIERTIAYTMVSASEKMVYQETVYTYDSKKVPFTVELGPVSVNNILSETDTVYNYDENGKQSVAYVSTFTYEYTYNEEGYPVSRTETYPNKTTITNYFIYR